MYLHLLILGTNWEKYLISVLRRVYLLIIENEIGADGSTTIGEALKLNRTLKILNLDITPSLFLKAC